MHPCLLGSPDVLAVGLLVFFLLLPLRVCLASREVLLHEPVVLDALPLQVIVKSAVNVSWWVWSRFPSLCWIPFGGLLLLGSY
jgi:hypothetical protein